MQPLQTTIHKSSSFAKAMEDKSLNPTADLPSKPWRTLAGNPVSYKINPPQILFLPFSIIIVALLRRPRVSGDPHNNGNSHLFTVLKGSIL